MPGTDGPLGGGGHRAASGGGRNSQEAFREGWLRAGSSGEAGRESKEVCPSECQHGGPQHTRAHARGHVPTSRLHAGGLGAGPRRVQAGTHPARACPGGGVAWVHEQPRCRGQALLWEGAGEPTRGWRDLCSVLARTRGGGGGDGGQKPVRPAPGSPDTHTWTRHEAGGRVTRHTHGPPLPRPPRQTDSQMGHVGAMPRHNRGPAIPRWPRPWAPAQPGRGHTGWAARLCLLPSLLLQSWRCSLPVALCGSPLPYLSEASNVLRRGSRPQHWKYSLALALDISPLYSGPAGPRSILTGHAYAFGREGALPLPPPVPRHYLDGPCPGMYPVAQKTAILTIPRGSPHRCLSVSRYSPQGSGPGDAALPLLPSVAPASSRPPVLT